MLTLIEQRQATAPIAPETVRTYRTNANFQACRDGLERLQGSASNQPAGAGKASGAEAAAERSQITVQQAAPNIRVQQAPPQIAVQQARPTVTVQQQRPEIVVRQPRATVTVDIPQPEITIRMHEPDVDVALARPEVSVDQPQPRVQFTQTNAQPQVNVQRQGNEQAEVQVRPATEQPQVRFERAEPRVVVNQQGQPQVRFERISGEEQRAQTSDRATMGQQQAARTDRPAQAAGVQEQRRTARTAEQRRAYQQRFGSIDTTAANSAPARAQTVLIGDIDDWDVYNARGERLGDIDRVILNPTDNKRYVIVEHGGFLGIGEDKVALPLERFAVGGDDRLVIQGVTEQDIDAVDNWRNDVADYRNLPDRDQVRLSVMQ